MIAATHMTAGDAFVMAVIIIGFFACLAGLVVFFATVAADIGAMVARRHLARHANPDSEPVPATIHPLARARSRREQSDTRPAA